MSNFAKISEIVLSNSRSWENKIFLTFDMDWAHDEILFDTLNILNLYSVNSTWFVTHKSSFINCLKTNLNVEIGIHPNFNKLLENEKINKDYKEILFDIFKLIPDAKSMRSHSMTQNSKILDISRSYGITHDVNHFIPNFSNLELKPWLHWNGLIKVPYIWEDDVHLLYESRNISEYEPRDIVKKNKGIKVFDFHPIHIFLNTECLTRYEKTRKLHQKPDKLIKYRFQGYGTRNRFINILKNNLKS